MSVTTSALARRPKRVFAHASAPRTTAVTANPMKCGAYAPGPVDGSVMMPATAVPMRTPATTVAKVSRAVSPAVSSTHRRAGRDSRSSRGSTGARVAVTGRGPVPVRRARARR